MTQPNVLLVVTDHWPAALLGAAGHPAVHTPVLNQLCRNGVRFTNCYSETPVCLPARRTLMTGTTPRIHGDRTFQPHRPMEPHLPTLAQSFRNAGYQAYAVGKTHTYPQRDRIGFDDILLDDEGRTLYGVTDDYEIFLGDQGFVGQQFGHGMSNNAYQATAWHLPEHVHATNWATDAMQRYVRRRDPTRPSFWYLGYRHPHPPLVPPQRFLDHYSGVEIDTPFCGDWANETEDLPYNLQGVRSRAVYSDREITWARRAFYALCTHIDQQIGALIGTIREEGILDETIVMFTSDHGDMLGNHGFWAKQTYYEGSSNVPMIVIGQKDDREVGFNRTDDRITGLQDVMPTLLGLAGIDVPETVEGCSMISDRPRDHLYGEFGEEAHASRMIRAGQYKLIWYPVGNHFQLFDIDADPQEMTDLAGDARHGATLDQLKTLLRAEMYGSDDKWCDGDEIVGEPGRKFHPGANRELSLTRGHQWPVPPINPKGGMKFFPEAPDGWDGSV
ncbi:arylsulfatase [Rhodophyticola sp. CCM32]|uniref:sulfatase-like hydrolase/transferase n=1 Tax=Rhodophyticola sp. CCM32 TaxID=2916397 RepID=UPI00107FCF23|nr:sulfatase-like hydrolase/transferase [Rhodophyticola sp. CCM32]QBY01294.1 arylsulfatase [Rhodophyticola sp. CCM32]